MAVTARFGADFESFYSAVTKANVSLRSFESEAGKVEKSLNRMADNFSGRKVIQDATLMTEAVSRVGGVSKLTEQELRTLGTTVAAAADKMRALGIDVPQKFQDIEKAAKGATSASEGWSSWLKSTTAILGAFGVSLGVGALVQFGKSLLTNADALRKMADQTGIGTDGLQKLGYAAGQSGNDLDQVTTAISQMQNRLAGDDKSAVKAVRDLGLSLDYLKTLSPDEQFIAIGDAIQKIPDPMQRTQMAMDLFGKSGAQILPTLTGDLRKLTDQAKDAGAVLSEQAVKSLDQFGDRMTAATTRGKVFVSEVLNGVINDAGAFIDAMKRMAGATDDFAKSRVALTEAGKIRQTELVADPLFPLGMGIDHLIERARALKVQLKEAITIKSWEEVSRIMGEMGAKGELSSEQMKLIIKAAKDFGGAAAESDPMVQGMVRGLEQIAPAASKAGSWLDLSGKKLTEMRAALAALTPEQIKNIKAFTDLGQSASEMAADVGVSAEVITAYVKALEKATAASKKHIEIQKEINKINMAAGAPLEEITEKLQHLGTAVPQKFFDDMAKGRSGIINLNAESRAPLDAFTEKLSHLGTAIPQEFFDRTAKMAELNDRLNGFIGPLDQTIFKIKTLGATVGEVFGALPNLLVSALTGGGGLTGALKAFGVTFTDSLFGKGGMLSGITTKVSSLFGSTGIGGAISQALGGILPGIGALIGPAIEGIKKLFRSAESEINPLRQKFVDAAGGLDALRDKATAAGVTIDALLNAKNAQQYEKAIQDLEKAFKNYEEELKKVDKVQEAVNFHFEHLQGAIKDASGALSDSMRDALRDLSALPGVSNDVAAALRGMANETRPNFEELTKMAKEYGIELKNLGPTFQQAHISDEAAKIINDFTNLKNAGADVGGVINGMADEIQKVVQDSLAFGTTIPENMRFMIEALINSNQLFDAQGKAIKDIASLKFGDPVETEADKIVKAIEALGDLLKLLPGIADKAGKGIQDALNNIQAPTIHVPVIPDFGNFTPPGAAMGGLVTSTGIQNFVGGGRVLPFRPRGTDTVPAMLTPGEGVLTRAEMYALGGVAGFKSLRELLRTGGAVGGDSSSLETKLDEIKAELQRSRVAGQAAVARAVRDEVQKVRRT